MNQLRSAIYWACIARALWRAWTHRPSRLRRLLITRYRQRVDEIWAEREGFGRGWEPELPDDGWEFQWLPTVKYVTGYRISWP